MSLFLDTGNEVKRDKRSFRDVGTVKVRVGGDAGFSLCGGQ